MLRIPGLAGLAVLLLLSVGCSSDSVLKMYVTEISGVSSDNFGKPYIECDIIGSHIAPCSAIQDMVNVSVMVETPGIGPLLDVYMTGYTLEYFYFDPADGQLKGPVVGLTQGGTLARIPLTGGIAAFDIIAMSYRVKTWSVGITCNDLAGYSGIDNISRMIVRVTVHGEDSTGKTLSADGSILAYIYDYAPAPKDPADDPTPEQSWCYMMSAETYWAAQCP